MDTLHEVRDAAKVIVLAAHIKRHGWQGSPLVVDGDQLLTGTHRYAACRLLGMTDGEIPTVDVREMFAAAGQDFDGIYASEDTGDWYQTLVYALESLPDSVRNAYGIDVH